MAGIGFELEKILRKKSLTSLIKAYSYSAAISSGPWLISIISILISGFLANKALGSSEVVTKFQVSVTYLIALSLIFTGFFQLAFTRYIADRIFEKLESKTLPNLMGVIFINMLFGFLIILPFSFALVDEAGAIFSLIYALTFSIFCGIWMLNIVLSGLKDYKYIIYSFLISYLLILALIYMLAKYGLTAMLASFFLGHAILFFLLAGLVLKKYPSDKLIEFDFLKSKMFVSLMFTGLFYNLGVWVDKFVFWFSEETSSKVLGWMRDSPIYDLPIFLAYLAIAPGMAVFLLRVETSFAKRYDLYYSAVRDGATLEHIYKAGNDMIESARDALTEILRVQSIITVLLIIFSEKIFSLLGLSHIYIPLFHIDLVATQLQLFFMSILAILFYLDRRKNVLMLTCLMFLLNAILSYITIQLGSTYYGYGYAISLLIVSALGMYILNRDFERLHYETFMLR